jgi:hypothetical protein
MAFVTAAAASHAYHAANNALAKTTRVDPQARGSIDTLQLRVERQDMIIQTLLMILLEKKVIHEDEFKEWMVYVDELDGARDGRLKEDKSPVVCPGCGRNSPRMAPKCVYCGHLFEPTFLVRAPEAKG